MIDWREKELKEIDIKTRKILTMNGVFHKKSNVDRLYIKRYEGGRGLISVEDCVKMEICNLKDYFSFNPELLTFAANEILFSVKCNDENDGEENENEIETGRQYKDRVLRERDARVWEKPMHGKFFREVVKHATQEMHYWVAKGNMNKTTEGYLFAAQEQALPTNWLKAKILGEGGDPMCRKCHKKVETVTHLVSGCSELSQYHYRKRHDKMGLRVYWELCKSFGIKCNDKWYNESPDKVRKSECGNFEIWWDRPVETPRKLEHNRPDVVLIDNKAKSWIIIDFSVPIDQNVLNKEEEKICRYNNLASEIRKLHNVKTNIIPLVIGALGVTSKNFKSYLKSIGISKGGDVFFLGVISANFKPYLKSIGISQVKKVFACMQMTAVLGSSIILRQVLNS